jgi:aminoglycoside phosphotransferase (APT) family kinase protein
VRTGEELHSAGLESFLLRHFQSSAPDSLKVEQFPRGHSNLTYLVRFGGLEMVLRRPPFGSVAKTAHDMYREYRVLSKLHAGYALAPQALVYCGDESVLGAPFYLMERVRGIILRKDPPPDCPFNTESARRLSESFIDNLARLHRLDYVAVGLGDLGKPEGYLERQVRGWIERYHQSQTHELPEVHAISTWLKEHLPVRTSASLIHNDYKYDNLVLGAEDITSVVAVLDWEMCTIGDPLSDLGTALAYWVEAEDSEELRKIRWCPSNYPGSLTRTQLADRYAKATGRDISGISFYLAFARFKAAVIAQQIFFRYQRGLTKDSRFAAMLDKVGILMRASLRVTETESL